MSGHPGPRQVKHLLDLLEELPLGDVEASTWAPLSRSDQRSFKVICRQSSHLANQLITSTHHDLHPPPSPHGQAAPQNEALWRQTIAARTAFLTRLPRLDSLKLSRWTSEAGLARELLLCGTASQGRVTRLSLVGQPLSVDSLRNVRLAFPQLRELSLLQGEMVGADEVLPFEIGLSGPLFLPLHGMPWLTKLSVTTPLPVDEKALRSLADLATLERLKLAFFDADLEPHCLCLLTGLHGLLHCVIDVSATDTTLPDFAALLAATRLTRLELHGAWEDHLDRQDAYPAAVHADALALLGGLSHLQCLHFGCDFGVDAATCAVIGRLTQLTELSVGEVHVSAARVLAPLPLLQQLHLGWHKQAFPPRILASLVPLMPLPSLSELNGEPLLVVDVSGADADEAAGAAGTWAASLQAALMGLASSPLLRHSDGVWFTNGSDSPVPRSLAQVAARLRPTPPGMLHTVSLHKLALEGAPWGLLHGCWPGLHTLSLVECQVSCAHLAACLEGMVTLQRLDVVDCEGMEGGSGWAVVAGHCCRPLQVKVEPNGVSEAELVRCRGVQQVLYGVQNIEWLEWLE